MRRIFADRLFTGEGWLDNTTIEVTPEGRISALLPETSVSGTGSAESQGGKISSATMVVPGFVDLQVYGGEGLLFSNQQTVEAIHATFREHSKTGTVAFQIAMNCNSAAAMWTAVDACRSYDGRGLVGLHLEGPFFNPLKRGAHSEEFVLKPSAQFIEELISRTTGVPTYLTVAPEMFSEDELLLLLRSHIRVSIGHTDATYDCATRAINQGANRVTHLFNAMSQWQSRSLGVVGAALDSPNCFASVIADGLHVDFRSIALAARLKPGRLFLITDAVTHDTSGPYSFIRSESVRSVQAPANPAPPPHYTDAHGVLAGSALTMDKAVLNVVRHADVPLDEALRMASLLPAQAAGLDGDLGSVQVGKRACLVQLAQDSLEVLQVWYDGVPLL